MDMANRIRDTRIKRRLSQQGLADKAGVSQMTICRIERGGESCYLVKIARALDVSAEYLTTGRGRAA